MKIKQDDFDALEQAINKVFFTVDTREYMERAIAQYSDMRIRWDFLHASGLKIGDGVGIMGDLNLHSYMNDNHIDTALKGILPL